VESSAAVRGADPQANPRASTLVHHYSSSTSTLSNPHTENLLSILDPITPDLAAESPVPEAVFSPASLNTEDIQLFVQKAIEGEPWRKYKINPPPSDRPVRIYADGDLIRYLTRTLNLC
jgi:choline-phosphate cytidylyltransferase